MTKTDPDILILVGSPRANGKSARFAEALREAFEAKGVHPCVFPLSDYPVAACHGCNACSSTGECVIVNDSFGVLSRHMDSADAAIIVSPVYFAGPSGWLKAALDRCQVYWARRYILGRPMPAHRPLHLCAVGEGGDPFGYEPMVTIVRSAMNSVGLRLDDEVVDLVGEAFDCAKAAELADKVMGEL